MTLREWMDYKHIDKRDYAFSKRLNVSINTLMHWYYRSQTPDSRSLIQLIEITSNAVSAAELAKKVRAAE